MNKLKTYAAHGLAYALSALTALAGAGLIPPQYLLAAGIVGGVLTGGANVVTASPSASLPPPVVRSLLLALLVLPFLMVAQGCQTLSNALQPGSLAQSVAIQYATAKYVEAAPEAERADRAAKVETVARSLKELAVGDTATLGNLRDRALAVVHGANLSVSDRVLANTLVAAVATELEARVAKGVLSADDRVKVAAVLDNVVVAASAYKAQPALF